MEDNQLNQSEGTEQKKPTGSGNSKGIFDGVFDFKAEKNRQPNQQEQTKFLHSDLFVEFSSAVLEDEASEDKPSKDQKEPKDQPQKEAKDQVKDKQAPKLQEQSSLPAELPNQDVDKDTIQKQAENEVLLDDIVQKDLIRKRAEESERRAREVILDGLESNDEEDEAEVIEEPQVFKPKEKYASIVISDDDNSRHEVDEDVQIISKNQVGKRKHIKTKQEGNQDNNQNRKKFNEPLFPVTMEQRKKNIEVKLQEQQQQKDKEQTLEREQQQKQQQQQSQRKPQSELVKKTIDLTTEHYEMEAIKSREEAITTKQQKQEFPSNQNQNRSNEPIEIYPDIPIQEDDGNVQDMDLMQEWVQIPSIVEIQTPKFQGFQRPVRINDKPKEMIKAFYGDQKFKDLLKQLGVGEEELWLYLGVKMMMGYMKLPDQNEYFFREDWIAGGGIRSVIIQQSFNEIEEKIDIVQPQQMNLSGLAVKLESNATNFFYQEFLPQFLNDLNEKFRKTVTPGQELLLIQNQSILPYSSQIEWYQLIDKQSGFILNQFFWNNPDKKNQSLSSHRDLQKRLRQMFEPYHLNRHIVYSNGILDAESVMLLHPNKVYICSDLKQHQLLPSPPHTGIGYFSSKHKEPIYLVYKGQWITFASHATLIQRNSSLSTLNQNLLNEEKLYILPPNSNEYKPSQIIFCFIFESIFHNVASISNQLDKNFKAFRTQVALQLIESDMNFSTPVPLTKKKTLLSSDCQCQTDMTIGIVNDQLFHCPVHDGNARCLVCLKLGILSKTTASCIGCSKALGHKIFICVYPCFRLFHLNPKNFLNAEEYYQIIQGYDQYDQEEDQEETKVPLKPETHELDQMYQKNHQDFDEDLIPHAIPINYEDNYRQKTKIKYIYTNKPKPKKSGRPKQKKDTRPQEAPTRQQSEPVDVGKKGRKGQKKQQQNQQEVPQEHEFESRNSLMDFFQMVRKKVNLGARQESEK